jgi:hypothetical protein
LTFRSPSHGAGLAALAALTLAAGCWYNTTGRSGASIGNIYIPFFQDQTTGERAVNLGTDLTELVVSEFQKDRHIRVYQAESERSQADKELLGTVQRISETVLTRNPQEEQEEYRVVVACAITYTDLKTSKVLWQETVSGDGNYLLPEGETGFQAAKDKALRVIVDRILDKTIKAW